MIDIVWIIPVTIAVNTACVAAGLAAAKSYGMDVCLQRTAAPALLLVGTGLECLAVGRQDGFATQALLIAAFGAVVSAAALDAACGYVFDTVTFPCLLAMAAIATAAHALLPFLLGAGACAGCLAALYVLSRGRGLGLGDVKLACCIGGAIGVRYSVEALGVAFVLGGAYASYLLVTKRARRGDEMRFAPYMAAGMLAVVLHGAAV